MPDRDHLLSLASRVEAAEGADNALDVEVEIALFKPSRVYSGMRSNAAGTKVIYTDFTGNDVTCWAEDWTMAARKQSTIEALRAHSQDQNHG